MNIIIIVVAVTAGVILGGTAIYVYQGKCRQKELKLLAECMEKILREEKIRETKAGEETLYARLESRLVRIQEMLNGRTEACLLYTSDAVDEEDSGDLGGRGNIKKKKKKMIR